MKSVHNLITTIIVSLILCFHSDWISAQTYELTGRIPEADNSKMKQYIDRQYKIIAETRTFLKSSDDNGSNRTNILDNGINAAFIVGDDSAIIQFVNAHPSFDPSILNPRRKAILGFLYTEEGEYEKAHHLFSESGLFERSYLDEMALAAEKTGHDLEALELHEKRLENAILNGKDAILADIVRISILIDSKSLVEENVRRFVQLLLTDRYVYPLTEARYFQNLKNQLEEAGYPALAKYAEKSYKPAPEIKEQIKSAQKAERRCDKGKIKACVELIAAYENESLFLEERLQVSEKACQKGADVGCFVMAKYYHGGIIVEKNRKLAHDYFADLCQSGYAEACQFAGFFFSRPGENPDIGQARQFFKRGCELGHDQSCITMGLTYEFPQHYFPAGVKIEQPNPAKAKIYRDKACAINPKLFCPN